MCWKINPPFALRITFETRHMQHYRMLSMQYLPGTCKIYNIVSLHTVHDMLEHSPISMAIFYESLKMTVE